jgi:hypothetical protein
MLRRNYDLKQFAVKQRFKLFFWSFSYWPTWLSLICSFATIVAGSYYILQAGYPYYFGSLLSWVCVVGYLLTLIWVVDRRVIPERYPNAIEKD